MWSRFQSLTGRLKTEETMLDVAKLDKVSIPHR